MEQRIIQRALENNQDMPPEVRSMVENMTRGSMLGIMAVIGVIIRAICFGVIAMLGGLLGVAIFKKKDLPPPGTAEILPPVTPNP
jgi:pheromone shutdown protein TraB